MQLERYTDYSFVLLSGWTHTRMAAIQRDLVKHLRRDWQSIARELISIRIPFGIRKPKGTAGEEKSQTYVEEWERSPRGALATTA
jgi:hypothetical protein